MYKNKIREYRKKQAMTLKELSDKIGISSGYLCHLERGTRKNPSIKTMEKIANALQKSITDIFFIQE